MRYTSASAIVSAGHKQAIILSECFGVVLGVEVEDLPGAGGVVDFPGVVGCAVEDIEADVFGFDAGFNHASYVAVAEPAYEAAGVRSGTVVGTRSAETDADDADAVVFVEVATEGFAEYLADGVGAVGSVGHVVGD